MAQQGQWIGRSDGDVPGIIVLELDELEGRLDGIAYLFPDDPAVPSSVAYLTDLDPAAQKHAQAAVVRAVNPDLGWVLTPSLFAEQFPAYAMSETAQVSVEFAEGTAAVHYVTEMTEGRATLALSNAGTPSVLEPEPTVRNWRDFRAWAFEERPGRKIYRGQATNHRLRTSFHRTRRKNLARYRDDDITDLRLALAPRLNHVFSVDNPLETGALYNLAQHHGYPTPLLDWSYSPFVAAFFAYRQKPRNRPADDVVRIFNFDQRRYEAVMRPQPFTAYARPHFSVISLLAIENQRAGPQQATATITNVDDIESFLRAFEQDQQTSILGAVDLPLADREEALADLSLMGITAGSLFPGLDGVCEALTFKNFGG